MSKSRILRGHAVFCRRRCARSFFAIEEIYVLIGIGVLVCVMLAFSRDMKVVLYSAMAGVSRLSVCYGFHHLNRGSSCRKQVGTNITIEGEVVRDPEFRNTTQRLVVAPQSASAEKILVVAPRYPETAYGDTVRDGYTKRPENFSADLTMRGISRKTIFIYDELRMLRWCARGAVYGEACLHLKIS